MEDDALRRTLGAGRRWLKQLLRGRDSRGDYAQVGAAGGGSGAVQMTDMETLAANGSADSGSLQGWDEEAQALVRSVNPAQVQPA